MDIQILNLYENSKDIFPIEKSTYKRDWMDAYPNAFAYRCLPLKIANECGWVIKCPVDFDAVYTTDNDPVGSATVTIKGSGDDEKYKNYIMSHFGRGVITFSLPFILKTPEPWCIWARGYPNHYKENVSFLEGIVETYWLHSTFTYNIRLVEKNKVVSFKKGEPLIFMTCININDINKSSMCHNSMDNYPELQEGYDKWNVSRAKFNADKNRGPNDWQKDYQKGLNYKDKTEDKHLTNIKTFVKD
tara:strand:- start:1374 stop:2108 length:735 start_codon:yes stop_codon:yes gene_type:complete